MPLSFDPVACVLGFIAILLAWKAYTSSSHFMIHTKSTSNGGRQSMEYCGPVFEAELFNSGIPVHNVSFFLSFDRDSNDAMSRGFSHWCHSVEKGATLEKGMSVKISVRPMAHCSSEIDCQRIEKHFSQLKDPRRQRACLEVRSGEFIVSRIYLYSRFDPLKHQWNRFVSRVNKLMKRDLLAPSILPTFSIASQQLKHFVGDCGTLEEWMKIRANMLETVGLAKRMVK